MSGEVPTLCATGTDRPLPPRTEYVISPNTPESKSVAYKVKIHVYQTQSLKSKY